MSSVVESIVGYTAIIDVYLGEQKVKGLRCYDLDTTVVSSECCHLLKIVPGVSKRHGQLFLKASARISISGTPTRFERPVEIWRVHGFAVLVGADLWPEASNDSGWDSSASIVSTIWRDIASAAG